MTDIKEEILKEFENGFVKITYPFFCNPVNSNLGGQHNFFKDKNEVEELWEMEMIEKLKLFLSQAIDRVEEDILKRFVNGGFTTMELESIKRQVEQATIQKVIDSLPKEKEEKVFCAGNRCSGFYNLECDAEEHPYLKDGKNRIYKGYNQCLKEILDKLKGLQDENT